MEKAWLYNLGTGLGSWLCHKHVGWAGANQWISLCLNFPSGHWEWWKSCFFFFPVCFGVYRLQGPLWWVCILHSTPFLRFVVALSTRTAILPVLQCFDFWQYFQVIWQLQKSTGSWTSASLAPVLWSVCPARLTVPEFSVFYPVFKSELQWEGGQEASPDMFPALTGFLFGGQDRQLPPALIVLTWKHRNRCPGSEWRAVSPNILLLTVASSRSSGKCKSIRAVQRYTFPAVSTQL